MQGKIYLNTRKGQQLKNGNYPLVCEITWNSNQKPFSLKMNFPKEEWDFNKQLPKKNKTKQLIVNNKRSLLDSLLLKSLIDSSIDFNYIKNALTGKLELGNSNSTNLKIDFIKFGYELAEIKKKEVNAKGIVKEGNGESYITALNQLKKFKNPIYISEIDYKLLSEFKNQKLILGNKKNTLKAYLSALRAIYNECKRQHKLKFDHNPFEGIFTGITVKKNRTKKRNISKEAIKILESLEGNFVKGQQDSINLFLLQFYFGGQDLTDIYYLEKKSISNLDRAYFMRGKLDDGGYEFDLKIFSKTKRILNQFLSRDNFVIPGRKDYKGYTNFRKRINANLKRIQLRYNHHIDNIERITSKKYHKLELLPLGGPITTKVARHTFSTIANRMYVEPDLLRSLMGHERDHVDTIYKDVYPEEERDKYHLKIIDTSDIQISKFYIYQLEYLNSERKRNYKYKYFKNIPSQKKLIDTNGKIYIEPNYFKRIFLIEK
ncbi:hypothetical protein BTO06_00240 [Tenacibaculum sp. SZ-18]|uniref:phage integrase SAM-like domain-containing protein n=1 Tax=Tenacibaculum sp. SZ-18 TaxID=754423 RepID=UPI000C2D3388|nr:phage integrase SAM-like domain-containing protein [Tenacibaculum sp. SZ-18]AUC13666.1 hypothetical protein BTO06_00240 [Tenacibaculum sp. SZ-18]